MSQLAQTNEGKWRTLVRRTWCRAQRFQAGAWKVKPRFRKASGGVPGAHRFVMGGSLRSSVPQVSATRPIRAVH